MSRVSGEDQFKLFKFLMEEVAAACGFNDSYDLLSGKQRGSILEQIEKSRINKDDLPFISASTLRDYKYKYQEKPDSRYTPFSAESEKLSVLTEFLNQGSWETFYGKFGNKEPKVADWSFYNAANLTGVLERSRERFSQIAAEKMKKLKNNNQNHELLFDLGVCCLFTKKFTQATLYFHAGYFLGSLSHRYKFFMALGYLNGKRPFRHTKETIDKILELLQSHADESTEVPEAKYLISLVYVDHHERIGRPYQQFSKIPKPPKVMFELIAKCSDISTNELNKMMSPYEC